VILHVVSGEIAELIADVKLTRLSKDNEYLSHTSVSYDIANVHIITGYNQSD